MPKLCTNIAFPFISNFIALKKLFRDYSRDANYRIGGIESSQKESQHEKKDMSESLNSQVYKFILAGYPIGEVLTTTITRMKSLLSFLMIICYLII